MTLYSRTYQSPLGKIVIASTDTAITALSFEDVGAMRVGAGLCPRPNDVETIDKRNNEVIGLCGRGQSPAPTPSMTSATTPSDEAVAWLDTFFTGQQPTFTPPLQLIGTPFQQRVWQHIATIPYGTTTTYGKIAQALGIRSARAIGNAVGRNPIALIIPCHRVVGSKGKLTGYAGGLDRKQALLTLEHSKF